jgi:hypothetical protein
MKNILRTLTDSIVHSLKNGRPHPSPLSTQCHNLRDLKGGIVAQTELDKLALLVELINLLQGLGKGHRSISGMQVENIHLITAQLLQGGLETLAQVLRLVLARNIGVALGGQLKTSFLLQGLTRPSFLFTVDVGPRCIHFIETL